MGTIDLSIVIVNWNVRDLLHQCLESIEGCATRSGGMWEGRGGAAHDRTWAYEVFVVDNASTDGSVDMVRDSFPKVQVVENGENLGFTVANNQAMRETSGRYVLLLNCDTEVTGASLPTMLRYLDSHSEVGGLGPQLLNPDGTIQSSRRRFPSLSTALLESTILQQWIPNHKALAQYYMSDLTDDRTQYVDWVVGACMMVRREVIEQVGLLDEGFFMYSEELDWCYRIKRAGWQMVYLPTAQVIHYGGRSSDQVIPSRHIHFQTSKVRYFRKHHGVMRSEIVRWFILATYLWQLIEEGAKWVVGHKRSLRVDRVRAYKRVLRSGLRQRSSVGDSDNASADGSDDA